MVDLVPEINAWDITYEMLFEFMEKAPEGTVFEEI